MDLKELLRCGLNDDDWRWDWTTRGIGKSAQRTVHARILAKSDGIWAATALGEAATALVSDLAPGCGFRVETRVAEGSQLKRGSVVEEWTGPARIVLALERPYLNLAAYACGIATATHGLVEKVARACPGRPPRVAPTRKILPAYRPLALAAVLAGGGYPHRVSLSGGVLIKENHVAAAGGIRAAVEGARAAAPHGLKIECEVRDESELTHAIAAGADGVLLDNFTPAQVKSALARLHDGSGGPRPFVEVSGGLDETNIAQYALEGVDVLSCGWITHSVRAVDLSLLVNP